MEDRRRKWELEKTGNKEKKKNKNEKKQFENAVDFIRSDGFANIVRKP